MSEFYLLILDWLKTIKRFNWLIYNNNIIVKFYFEAINFESKTVFQFKTQTNQHYFIWELDLKNLGH